MMLLAKSIVSTFGALLALGFSCAAAAQTGGYPSKPVKIIAPFAPGGQVDLLGRIMGQKLSELWGQPVVVENLSGAGGTIGMDRAANAPADGYTLAMGTSATLAIGPSLYAKLPYDPLRDLAPVANVALIPWVLVIDANLPARTIKELIDLAKSRKDAPSFGSAGSGSLSHLAGELFSSMTGAALLHVPFKGSAPAVNAVLAGQIDMLFVDVEAIARYAAAGKLRALAATGAARVAALPTVPTMAEAGVDGYAVESWIGIVVPARTPKDVVAALNAAVVTALKSPDVRQRFNAMGYVAIGDTPEQFGATIRAESEKWARVIREAGIKAE